MPHPLLRHGRLHVLSVIAQAVVLGVAAGHGTRQGWLTALLTLLALNAFMWLRSLRHGWAIRDTPTSRVGSAAQGYVELQGRAEPHGGVYATSPVTQLPCLWFHYTMEHRQDNNWRHAGSGESDLPFALDDGSGRCVLEPRGAHIHSKHRERRTHGDTRYTEHVLLKGDTLYAIGTFASERAAEQLPPARIEEGNLLGQWKEDPATLHERFDLNGDGEIDAREWALARMAARREVARRRREVGAMPATHRMRKPDDGRPYLIANHPPETLARGYLRWAAFHLALLLASLIGVGWALRLP